MFPCETVMVRKSCTVVLAVVFSLSVAAAQETKRPRFGSETRKSKAKKAPGTRNPHPTTLVFDLSRAGLPKDQDAIRSSLTKLKGVSAVAVDPKGRSVRVEFDSHAISFHQVAQAIADARTATGKDYDPRLQIEVPQYAQADNAAKVDAILSAKRLGQRVRVEALDKSRGLFVLRFSPLKLDPALAGPHGFNGGHLNHPIHDVPPRGLGLEFRYNGDPKTPDLDSQ
jgi:copper chaperone CopZ